MRIREVEPADYPIVGPLTVAAYTDTGHPPTDSYLPSLLDVGARVAAGAIVLVAEVDGVVRGSATLTLDDNPYFEYRYGIDGDCGFRMLAVDPPAQGLGAGAALADTMIARARDAGLQRMTITSMSWMTTAHGIYVHRGFVRVPELDLYFPPGKGMTYSLALQPDTPAFEPAPYPEGYPWAVPGWTPPEREDT